MEDRWREVEDCWRIVVMVCGKQVSFAAGANVVLPRDPCMVLRKRPMRGKRARWGRRGALHDRVCVELIQICVLRLRTSGTLICLLAGNISASLN